VRSRRQDKGHRAQFVHLRTCLTEGATNARLDPLDSMQVTLVALDSAVIGQTIQLDYSST
jgi:hypothetical protein